MDLIREILLAAESLPAKNAFHKIQIEGRDSNEVAAHLLLLGDAGMAEVWNNSGLGSAYDVTLKRLTWEGHEFLELVRDEERYSEAKGEVHKLTNSLGFEAFKTILVEMVKRAIASNF